jgi:hypothetical protein
MLRLASFISVLVLSFFLVACSDSTATEPDALPTLDPSKVDSYLIGRPQNRSGIGDVDLAFARYANVRPELVELFKAQPWFKDGLTRPEALFVERALTFVARFDGPRSAYVGEATIENKLFKYERVRLANGEVELLLIYEPGQDAERQMAMMTAMIPALEALVGVEFPEHVLTVINGRFEINDFNDGQFIRIALCCTNSAFVLAHELAHAYWSMAPSWFNEGMADIYAVMTIERLNRVSPPGWRPVPLDIESFYTARKAAAASGRFPDMLLPRRLASQGLYEVADAFLLDIRNLIGDQAFRSAARDIYLASDFGRLTIRDKRIQDTFLKHAAPDVQEEITALFNRQIWGDDGERYRQLQELEGF